MTHYGENIARICGSSATARRTSHSDREAIGGSRQNRRIAGVRARDTPVLWAIRIQLNNADRAARAGYVNAHAAGGLGTIDDRMNRVAGRCPAHTSRRIVSGLEPGAGDLAAT